jgi:uncharacterized Zn finger protein
MNEWDRFRWPPRAAKQPPPEHGIGLKKAGTTWWGRRWIEALEQVLRGDAGRLARGKTYARAGRTHDLVVSGGTITARVTGTRPTPYAVSIQLAQLPDDVWQRAIDGLASKAQFAAVLLGGQMPEAIDEVFRAAGSSLFPEQRSDLVTACSCPDSGDPCKHVAATHYLLGEALDGDPFLLFELRGRSKARVLAGIREARAGSSSAEQPGAGAEGRAASSAAVPRVTLAAVAEGDYDRPRAAWPLLEFSFEAPRSSAAVLRQLGAPGAWRAEASPAELLAPLVQRAADAARRIALGEDEPREPERSAPATATRVPRAAPARGERKAKKKTKTRAPPGPAGRPRKRKGAS